MSNVSGVVADLAGLKFFVEDGELQIYKPGAEGYSEFITPETVSKLEFILLLAKLNVNEAPHIKHAQPDERAEVRDLLVEAHRLHG